MEWLTAMGSWSLKGCSGVVDWNGELADGGL